MKQRNSANFPVFVAGAVALGWLLAVPASAQIVRPKPPVTEAPTPKEKGTKAERHSRTERDEVARRMEWFYRQRRYPLPLIPGGARMNALQQRDANRREQAHGGMAANGLTPNQAASFNAWTPIGPTPTSGQGFDFLDETFNVTSFSGRINAIQVDPVDTSIIYLGGADGGLWRSSNGGSTWTALTDTQPSLAIGAIAIDPNSCGAGYCQTMYVGTGEANNNGDAYYGAGVLELTMTGSAASPTYTFTQLGANAGSVTLIAGYTPPNNTPAPNSFVGPFDVAVGGAYFSDIVVNPTNSQILLAAVRIFENADGGASSGVFCSDNAGVNWTQVVSGAAGTALVIAPTGTTAFAALGTFSGDPQNGIYETSNANASCSSQSWSLIAGASKFALPAGAALGRISLALAPGTTAPFTLYAAVANGGNDSGGEADESEDLIDVYKSTNSGSSWTATHAPNICTAQCWYDMTIKVHPNNANVVFLGGAAVVDEKTGNDEYLLRSQNGGTTWDGTTATEIAFDGTNEIHVDQHAIAFSPPTAGASSYTMFVGNDGGAWSTPMTCASSLGAPNCSTVAWTDLNTTLTLSQFYPGITIHPSSQLVAIGGLQDNGSQKYDAGTVPGSTIWTQINGADGGATYIDVAVPNTVYTTTEFISDDIFFIEKSTQNGDIDSTGAVTFSPATNGINGNGLGTDYAEFIPSLTGDPTPGNNRVLYYPTCQIYQSRDGADNWSAMTSSSLCGFGVADYVAIAPATDGNTVYAVDSIGHVHVTTNAEAGSEGVWTDVSSSPLPAASSTVDPVDGRESVSAAVSPTNPQFAVVGYSGFCGFTNITNGTPDNVGHIFETTNGGTTWTDISGGCDSTPGQSLPNTPVNAIVIDPADTTNNTIYVGTDVGVFMTSNGGGTWVELDQSPRTLPDGAVLSLTLRNASRTLRAGLHGRGVWDYQLPLTSAQSTYSLANIIPVFAAQGGTSPVSLTVNGQGFAAGDTVNYNGVPLTTSFGSSTQLTATIPAAMLANAGTASITVVDPTNGTSNAVPFSVEVVFSASASAPPNNLFASAISIPATLLSYTDVEDTVNAAASTSPTTLVSSGCVVSSSGLVSSGDANSIWYSYTPATNALVEADTIGSTVPNSSAAEAAGLFAEADTILWVGTGTPGHFTQVACNDDIANSAADPQGFITSEVNFNATAGTTYYFMVSEYEGVGGVTVFNMNATPTPTLNSITPASGTAGTSFPVTLLGSDFTAPLTMNCCGTGASFSDIQIVGSSMITATMTLSPATAPGVDTLDVAEINSGAISNTVQFTVLMGAPVPPTISSISPSAAVLGTSNLPVAITGTDFASGPNFTLNAPAGISVNSFQVASSTLVTASISVAANAASGPQSISVSNGPNLTSNNEPFTVGTDFMISANPTSASVTAGGSASTTLTITPVTPNTQFPANLVLSASGIPAQTSCSFTSTAAGFMGGTTGTVPAADGTAASTTVTFMCTTTASSTTLVAPRVHAPREPWGGHPFARLAWSALLLALGAGTLAAGRGRSARLRWTGTALLILAMSAFTGACGGGSSAPTPPPTSPGTPAGTYMITVSGTTANALHTAAFTLTVQ